MNRFKFIGAAIAVLVIVLIAFKAAALLWVVLFYFCLIYLVIKLCQAAFQEIYPQTE